MARRHRVKKSLEQKLRDLDDLLYLLRQALSDLPQDSAHLRSVAVHLRSLVCLSSGTEGLLWRLADELDVSDVIELHLAGGVDPDHPLAYAMAFAIVPIHRKGRGPSQLPPAPSSLRQVIKENEAVFIRGKSLTHEGLIKSVAEQLGGAHESEDIDHELVNLAQVKIGNAESYVGVLTTVADLALEVGERVLTAAETRDLLTRKDRPDPSSDLTVAVRVQFQERLAGRVPVLTIASPIAGVQIKCLAGPLSWVFQCFRGEELVLECAVDYPEDLEVHKDMVFSLEYSSRAHEARIGIDGLSPDGPISCPIGFVYAEDLRETAAHPEREGLVAIQFALVFKGLLGPEKLKQLLELTPELLKQLMGGRAHQ